MSDIQTTRGRREAERRPTAAAEEIDCRRITDAAPTAPNSGWATTSGLRRSGSAAARWARCPPSPA